MINVSIMGVLVVAAGAIFDVSVLHTRWLVGVTALPGVYMFVRAFRLGVTITPETVIVRGLVRSREIDRHLITDVTGFPSVEWISAPRTVSKTPILAFASSNRATRSLREHNAEIIADLRRTLKPLPIARDAHPTD